MSGKPEAFAPGQLDAFRGRGFALIPLHKPDDERDGKPVGKAPLNTNWRIVAPMSVDEAKAHMEIGGGNVGVRLARSQLVVDVDPRNFAEGEDSLDQLQISLGIDFDRFPMVETGGGGRHFYMLKPVETEVVGQLREFPGVEFKTEGKQVVAPGSIHPDTGRVYRWDALSAPLSEIGEAPGVLLSAIAKPVATEGQAVAGVRSPEVLGQLLALLDVGEFADHDEWLRIMMASHHATAGAGRQEFIEWSVSDPAYAQDANAIGRRWDSLKSGGAAAVTEATLFKAIRDAGHGDALNAIIASDDFADIVEDSPPSRPVPPKLAEVNARHFTVLTAGKYLVGRESICPHLGHVVVEWFPDVAVQKHLNASTVTLEDGTRRPLGTWWIKHGGRRQYDGVVFDPTPGAKHPGLYNLWRGWTVTPIRGDWSLMQRLLRDVLCAGDQASFEYVLMWAAYMVQHPNSPAEVALVFKGRKGIGKGTFLRALKELAGQHGRQVAQADHFTGKFNEHLADTILLFVDEGLWAGDRKLEGALKNLITEPVLTFEGKHKPVVSGPNRLHVVIASNEDWVVPASDDERRFAVFEADSEAHRNLPPGFFNDLRRQMESGGLAAMLFDLAEMPLAGWHPRSDIPITRALTEQKVQSFRSDPIAFWWYRALEDGCLPVGGAWSDALDIDSEGKGGLVHAVEYQAAVMKKRAEFTKTALARFLGKVGVDVAARDRKGGKVWRIPALPDARAAFEAWVGGPIVWDEDGEQA
jgi:hypothetical protein